MQHPKEVYVTEIERSGGNLRKAAAFLGVGVPAVYNAIKTFDLWPVVNAARVKRIKAEPTDPAIVKARRALKG